MSTGGEIKSTLTLDVSRFSTSLEKAMGGLDSLDRQMKSAVKVAADFDKGIVKAGEDLASVASSFRLLDQTLIGLVGRFDAVASNVGKISRVSGDASAGVNKLSASMKAAAGIKAEKWIGDYTSELSKFGPAIKQAVSSILELDKATAASSKSSVQAAGKSAEARIKALAAERDANKQVLESRKTLQGELLAMEREFASRAEAAQARIEEARRKKRSGAAARADLAEAQGAAQAAREEVLAVQEVMKQIRFKNIGIGETIKLLESEIAKTRQAAEEQKRKTEATRADTREMAREARDQAALARQAAQDNARQMREAYAERMRLSREAALAERQSMQENALMWKSMGQLWGASKIQSGMRQGLDKANEYQQTELRVGLMNLPGDEFDRFKQKAFDISKEEKYISVIETLQSRLDALAAFGYNNEATIDATMQSAIRNSQILLSGGYEHGTRSNLIQNLYGFAESRQVMNDPEEVKRSFEIARRMSVVSNGKINIADIENVARNMGDLRQTMSMEGWMNVAALMEQFKVSGGHGSGAGSGVQSVGTMLKMMSLYAAGKPVTNQAAIQLLGANVMNDIYTNGEAQNFQEGAKNNAMFSKMVKTAGFKNAKEMQANPVNFFSSLRDQVLGYTKDEKNKSTFYDGEDTQSKEAETTALKKFFSRMGMSNKTVDGLLLMMDKGFIERNKHVQESAKKLDDEDAAIQKMRHTWKTAVDEMNAGAANLAVAFVPLLEPLAKIPRAIGEILNKAAALAKDNPIAATMDLGLVAAAGLTLALKGAVGIMGSLGGALNPIRVLMAGAATGIGTAAGALSSLRAGAAAVAVAFPSAAVVVETAFAGMSGVFARVGAALTGLIPNWLAVMSATWAGAFGSALGWLGRLSGSLLGFIARWASPVAWAALAGQMGWVIGEWASSIEVGGITIGKRMQNVYLDIEMGWRNMLSRVKESWIDFKKLIGGGDYLDESKDRAELAAQRAANAQYEKNMRWVAPPPKVAPLGVKSGDAGKDKAGKTDGVPPARDASDIFNKPKRPARTAERSLENAWARQFYGAQSRAEIESLKLDAIDSGESTFEEQARQEIIKMWAGGDFDDGKDPARRKFLKGASYGKDGIATVGGKKYDQTKPWGIDQMDWTAKFDVGGGVKKSLEDLLPLIKARKEEQALVKALSFAKERERALNAEAGASINELTGKTAGQTDAMKALLREYERLEGRTPGAASSKEYQTGKMNALTSRATIDYASKAIELRQANEQFAAQFANTELDRLRISADASYAAQKKKAQAVQDSLNEQVAAHERAGDTISQEYLNAVAARKAGEESFTLYLKNISEERRRALMAPIERMAIEWADSYKTVQDLQVQWSNGFIDNLNQMIMTGRASWKDFIVGMLSDLSRTALKKGFSELIKVGVSKAEGGSKDGQEKLGGATDYLTSAMQTLANTGIGQMMSQMLQWLGITTVKTTADANAAGSVANLAASATAAAFRLDALAASGSGSSGVGGLAGLFSGGGSSSGGQLAAPNMAGTEGMDWGVMAESFAGFANGGIMTSMGPVPLNMYRNGGIANSPQMAIFGEGSMNEAYVPLPDGRSIPVTMMGSGSGGGDNVAISITVNHNGSEQKTGSPSGNESAVWSRVADRVKAVVRDEIIQQKRPGGVLA